jgi:hypothetical protein
VSKKQKHNERVTQKNYEGIVPFYHDPNPKQPLTETVRVLRYDCSNPFLQL